MTTTRLEVSTHSTITEVITTSLPVPSDSRPMPPLTQALLHGLSQQAYRMHVMGGGRCSVAALLLALGVIPDQHENRQYQILID